MWMERYFRALASLLSLLVYICRANQSEVGSPIQTFFSQHAQISASQDAAPQQYESLVGARAPQGLREHLTRCHESKLRQKLLSHQGERPEITHQVNDGY
jgi:hypothetical protein